METGWQIIPKELWLGIMRLLPEDELRRCREVCLQWKNGAEDSSVWSATRTFFQHWGSRVETPWNLKLGLVESRPGRPDPAQLHIRTRFGEGEPSITASATGTLVLHPGNGLPVVELLPSPAHALRFAHDPACAATHRQSRVGVMASRCGCASLWTKNDKLSIGFLSGRQSVMESPSIRVLTFSGTSDGANLRTTIIDHYSGPTFCQQGRFVTFGETWPCFALHLSESDQEKPCLRLIELDSRPWQVCLALESSVVGVPLFIESAGDGQQRLILAGYSDGAVRVWQVDPSAESLSRHSPALILHGLSAAAMGASHGWSVTKIHGELSLICPTSQGDLKATSLLTGQTLYSINGGGHHFLSVDKLSLGVNSYWITAWQSKEQWTLRVIDSEIGRVIHTRHVTSQGIPLQLLIAFKNAPILVMQEQRSGKIVDRTFQIGVEERAVSFMELFQSIGKRALRAIGMESA